MVSTCNSKGQHTGINTEGGYNLEETRESFVCNRYKMYWEMEPK